MDEITYRDGFDAMDFTRATEMLSKAYWCLGIGLDEMVEGARNSALVVGAFDAGGRQIGYARVISDTVRFAYVTDVYVEEGYRKLGIGQGMMRRILSHPSLSKVYQWLLITKDAHEVYRKVGFTTLTRPPDWLQIWKTRASIGW
jgi:GNAT superfamily N-acetyltransferase